MNVLNIRNPKTGAWDGVPAIRGPRGKPGSDASVTAENIQSALGYTPVNPGKLSMGIHTDGLCYLFVDGQPVGHGVEMVTGGDVVGYVDSENNIVVKGSLADGTYSVKYEMEDGSVVPIGQLVLAQEEPEAPAYTNLLPQAVDANGNEFVGANGEDGYKYGYRISRSSGSETATDGVYCTGFMPVTLNDTIRISGIAKSADESHSNIVYYNSSKTYIGGVTLFGSNSDVSADGTSVTTEPSRSQTSGSIAFFRFSANSITDETIVTVNQEIE